MSSDNSNDDGCGLYIWIFILAIFSFGNAYKTYMVYNFGEYKEGIVLDKNSIYHPGFRGPGYNDYFVLIDVLGKEKECDVHLYDKLEKNTKIEFFVYKEDPNYLILTETKDKVLISMLSSSLQWYHKMFLIIFIISVLVVLILNYYKALSKIFRHKLKESGDNNSLDALLPTIIHLLIFVFGIGCAYYIGGVILNNISTNENLDIRLVGFYMMIMLAIVLITPFLIQKIYQKYQNGDKLLLKRLKQAAVIFTLINILAGFFGTLLNENPHDFSFGGMFQLILKYWDVILGG